MIKLIHALITNVGHGARCKSEQTAHDAAQDASAAATMPQKLRTYWPRYSRGNTSRNKLRNSHGISTAAIAITEDSNTITVYTGYDAETDTLTAPVPVITGLSDGVNVEIRSGLSAGDSYYYRYADAIAYRTE